ncbi:helix-turn-helix transcriptional regulator [Macrococcus equi]|uniref:helix-turn-helix transcriptional regulator n=1 Tax=Macrococcus equi TaxID=3395462 RepID=UPI0039BEC7E9
MNRAQRLLILYSRLTKNQYVNKEEIALEFNVHPRTIQRDIEDIREYLSNSNEHFYRQEIVYSHSENAYTISNHHLLKDSLPLRMILIQLYSLSPIIHRQVYETLKLIITENYSHDIRYLSILINAFKVVDNHTDYQLVSQLQDAITEKHIVNIVLDDIVIYNVHPLKIIYSHSDFSLVFRQDESEKSLKISGIKSIQKVHDFSASSQKTSTLEMTKEIWNILKDIFDVVLIESITNDSIIVSFNMTRIDLFETLLRYSPHIRLVDSPFSNDFFGHILSLNQTYFTQQIIMESEK